jgi:hypothetical protein
VVEAIYFKSLAPFYELKKTNFFMYAEIVSNKSIFEADTPLVIKIFKM